MNYLKQNLHKIDIGFLINNFRNDKLWKMKWKFFEYDNYVFRLSIDSINVKNSFLELRISIENEEKDVFNYTWFYVYFREIDNETTAYNRMHGKIIELIGQVNQKFIRESHIYRQAEEMDEAHSKKLTRTAEDFLDEQGVSNEEIREAYISYYVSKNEKSYRMNVYNGYKYHFVSTLALTYASYFGLTEKYEDIVKNLDVSNTVLENIELELKEFSEYLESEDMLKDMKDCLEQL